MGLCVTSWRGLRDFTVGAARPNGGGCRTVVGLWETHRDGIPIKTFMARPNRGGHVTLFFYEGKIS